RLGKPRNHRGTEAQRRQDGSSGRDFARRAFPTPLRPTANRGLHLSGRIVPMHGPSWIALLRRIPIQYHDSLAFSLTTGGEIVVQSLLRLERDFVSLRGRLSGSQDSGRVLILPYSQIVSLALQRRITDTEANAIFEQPLDFPASTHSSTQATEDTALDM